MTDDDKAPAPRQSLLLPIAIPVGLLAIIGVVLWGFSRVLLRVEPKVATVTALLVAASIVVIVAIAASQKRVTSGSLLSVIGGVFGAAMLLSGAALLVGQGTGEGGPEAVSVALAAPKGAAVSGYDVTTLSVPADTPFTIAFNNQDPGVPHNVAIYTDESATEPLFVGELVTGPGEVTYEVGPLDPGTYFFRCDVHPATMTGTFLVA